MQNKRQTPIQIKSMIAGWNVLGSILKGNRAINPAEDCCQYGREKSSND